MGLCGTPPFLLASICLLQLQGPAQGPRGQMSCSCFPEGSPPVIPQVPLQAALPGQPRWRPFQGLQPIRMNNSPLSAFSFLRVWEAGLELLPPPETGTSDLAQALGQQGHVWASPWIWAPLLSPLPHTLWCGQTVPRFPSLLTLGGPSSKAGQRLLRGLGQV